MIFSKNILLIKAILNIFKKVENSYNNLILVWLGSLLIFIADLLSIGFIFPLIISILDFNLLKQFILEHLIFLNFIFNYKYENILLIFLLLIILVSLVKFIATIFLSYKISIYFGNLQSRLEATLFDKFVNQDYIFFVNNRSTNLINYLKLETERAIFAIKNIVNITIELCATFFIFVFLFLFLDFNIIFFLCFFLIFSLFFTYFVKKFTSGYGLLRTQKYNLVLKILNETFSSIKDIAINNLQKIVQNKFIYENNILCRQDAKNFFLVSLPRMFFEFVLIISFVIIIFVLLKSDIEIGLIAVKLSIFGLASYRLFPSISRINVGIQSLRYRVNSIQLIGNSLINLVSKKTNNIDYEKVHFSNIMKNNLIFEIKNASLEFNNEIHKNKFRLSIDNLKIFDKDKILIFGESGSGKSTLVNIITCILKIDSGHIQINNNYYSNITDYQNSLGYVSQSSLLFDDNLFNNISLKLDHNIYDYSKEEINNIENVVKLVNLDKEKLYEKNIGEFGSKFSSGQKQKILIARLLYHKPKIIVLDEPTSFLDDKNDKIIIDEILKKFSDSIIILISHKIEHKKFFKKVIELKNGKIIQK